MIQSEDRPYRLCALCQSFGYSRQAYYKRQNATGARLSHERVLLDQVRQIRRRQPMVGTRKLYRMLEKDGHIIGRDRLFALLKREGLLIQRKRKRAYTTMSWHHYHCYPNLIKDKPKTAPNQVYVSDITYLQGPDRFYYLALITDAFSRKIVGYDLSESLSIDGSLRALEMAIKSLGKGTELIHHSDRGIQYCAHAYVERLTKQGISISMTEQDHVYENALAERVNGILKLTGPD